MKKVLLMLLASVAMVSCGSDDGNGKSKRPETVTIAGGTESYLFGMTYDNKGRLSTMSSNYVDNHTFSFSYNESGKVSNVGVTGSGASSVAFTYGTDGRLATLTRGGSPYTVNWTDASTVSIDGTVIKVDSNGDLAMIDQAVLTRDSGKGAFANVKGVDGLTMYLVEMTSAYYASKKPLKSFTGSGVGTVLTNQMQGGYVTSATFPVSGSNYVMNITY